MSKQNRKPVSDLEPIPSEMESIDLLIRISRITNVPFDSFLPDGSGKHAQQRTQEATKAEAEELATIFNTIGSAFLRRRLIAIARIFAGKEPYRN